MLFFYFFIFSLYSLFQKNKLSGFPFFGKKDSLCINEKKEDKININIKDQISYNLIKNINGFYGVIGPDIEVDDNTTLFNLFTGNGMIQGIFFDNGNITFIKRYIETEIFLYEKKNNQPFQNFYIGNFLSKINIGPKVLGYANTALLNIKDNELYALFERDMPYLLKLDFWRKDIFTIKRLDIKGIENFSGHTKYIDKDRIVETIDYNIFSKKVSFFQIDKEIQNILNKIELSFRYVPLVHDFISTDKNIIVIDSPIFIDTTNLFNKKIPLILDKKEKTYLYLINKKTYEKMEYGFNESFYLFHYSDYKETDDFIDIYACLYDDLDFSTIHIKGNYRILRIDKKKNEAYIIKNIEMEKYNLDFPVLFYDKNQNKNENKKKIILRNMQNQSFGINEGFLICEEMKIIKKIILKDQFICGEHKVIYINDNPYLLFFTFKSLNKKNINSKNSLFLINLNTFEKIEIDIPYQLKIGFHSIFIKK